VVAEQPSKPGEASNEAQAAAESETAPPNPEAAANDTQDTQSENEGAQ
jgi:hypothetical protein